jgi:hypothetical protein
MTCKHGWSGRDFPLEDALNCVGPGWAKIITRLYELYDKHGVAIEQIKEKFGGLRFYISEAPDEVHNAITEAEKESYTICEDCGKPGKIRNGSWLRIRRD